MFLVLVGLHVACCFGDFSSGCCVGWCKTEFLGIWVLSGIYFVSGFVDFVSLLFCVCFLATVMCLLFGVLRLGLLF